MLSIATVGRLVPDSSNWLNSDKDIERLERTGWIGRNDGIHRQCIGVDSAFQRIINQGLWSGFLGKAAQ